MMDFESQTESAAAEVDDFERRLIREIEKKAKAGNDGVGDNRVKYNFYMSLSVQNLGCEIAKSNFICPISWAAWLCNTELDEQENKVVLRVTSAFVAKSIVDKFGSVIKRHFQKPVIAKIDADLERHMKRI